MRTKIRGISGHPCQWPESWPQSKSRTSKPRCTVTFSQARDELLDSLRKMGALEVVISSNVPLKPDGLPYADAPERGIDPSVAVYWTDKKNKPRVIACDRWASVRENIRSIGLALEGLRAVERAGVTEILDRAYQGFAALPASAPTRRWWEVLDIAEATARGAEERGEVAREKMRSYIEARYRELARIRHPDVGGSHEAMLELNRAREDALIDIAPRSA